MIARNRLVSPEPRKGFPYAAHRAARPRLSQFRLLTSAILGFLIGFPGSPAKAADPGLQLPSNPADPIVTVAGVLALDASQARQSLPAIITGVVTYFEPKWDTLFIQDATGGIYVFPGKNRRPRFRPGQLLEITGRTIGNKPLNALGEESIEVLGTAPVPPPIPSTSADLLSGRHDSRWIEFDAVVRRWVVQNQRLEVGLAVEGTEFIAHSPWIEGRNPLPGFVHSRVRVQAVASQSADPEGNLLTVRVFVPDLANYTILHPPPADPFTLPVVAIPGPHGISTNVDWPADARRVVRGTIIHSDPGELVIQEGDAGVRASLLRNTPMTDPNGFEDLRPVPPRLVPGDSVEVVGYLAREPAPPRVVDAMVRTDVPPSPTHAPRPLTVTAVDIRKGDPLHTLVEVVAEFREELEPEKAEGSVLRRWRLYENSEPIEAAIPSAVGPALTVQPGTTVRLRGFVERKPSVPEGSKDYRLRLRSDADVVVVSPPAGWLNRDAARVLSYSTIVTLAILGWAILLWREGGAQRALNRQLEDRIKSRTTELTQANRRLEEKVADQRRVEGALLESEARIRAILEHSPDGIVVLDPATARFVEANEAAAALFGMSRADLIGKCSYDLSPLRQPDGVLSREGTTKYIHRTLAGGSHRFEWVHSDVEGRDFPCEINLALLPREGRMLVIGTLTDITARHRAGRIRKAIYEISEAANNAEDLPALYCRIHAVIRQLMNAENLYIASYDPVSDLISFPYYADEKDPTPPSRRPGRGFTEYVLRTGRPLLADRTACAELYERGDCIPVGSQAALWLGAPLALRGRPFGVLAVQEYHNPKAFGQDEKDVLGFVAEQIAIAIDRRRAVDDLRASEARLRESEERFSKAFHNCQGALAIVSLDDGRYLDVNEGFVRTYGYSRAEALGKTSLDLNLWQEPAHRERLFECLRATGSFRNEETVMRRNDGVILTTVESADVIEIGGRSCVIVFALDITARKQAEMEASIALAKERELSQLKTSFVSLVSHEFRTPLEIILSSGEILQRYHDRLAPDQRVRQLRAITSSVRHMAHMMNEVLLLGRFDAGRMEFLPAPVDLPAFCQRVADDIRAATDQRCPIHLDLHGDLAEAAGDEALLGHIFTNLLSNAVKYSPPAQPVAFRLRRHNDDAIFEVEDRGLGIPVADRARLFSAFHRGSNVGQAPGSGLGLVIVRRCTELHQGSLTYESKEGRGTTFAIRIPLWRPTSPTHPAESSSQPNPNLNPSPSPSSTS